MKDICVIQEFDTQESEIARIYLVKFSGTNKELQEQLDMIDLGDEYWESDICDSVHRAEYKLNKLGMEFSIIPEGLISCAYNGIYTEDFGYRG